MSRGNRNNLEGTRLTVTLEVIFENLGPVTLSNIQRALIKQTPLDVEELIEALNLSKRPIYMSSHGCNNDTKEAKITLIS